MNKKEYMVSAEEIAEKLCISKAHAYKLVRQMNEELLQNGYIIVAGKMPRPYWKEKMYGYSEQGEM